MARRSAQRQVGICAKGEPDDELRAPRVPLRKRLSLDVVVDITRMPTIVTSNSFFGSHSDTLQ